MFFLHPHWNVISVSSSNVFYKILVSPLNTVFEIIFINSFNLSTVAGVRLKCNKIHTYNMAYILHKTTIILSSDTITLYLQYSNTAYILHTRFIFLIYIHARICSPLSLLCTLPTFFSVFLFCSLPFRLVSLLLCRRNTCRSHSSDS